MASIGAPAILGTGAYGSATPSTTLTQTTGGGGAIPVGDMLVTIIAWRQLGALGTALGVVSVTDAEGNVWEHLGGYRGNVANGDAHIDVWGLKVSNAMPNNTTITVTFTEGINDACVTSLHVPITDEAGEMLIASLLGIGNEVNGANGFGSAAFSGLASAQRLYVRALAKRANSTTALTPTTNFSVTGSTRSRNDASNAIMLRGEYRVNTSTGETSNPTLAVSGNTAGVFLALELAQPSVIPSHLDWVNNGQTITGDFLTLGGGPDQGVAPGDVYTLLQFDGKWHRYWYAFSGYDSAPASVGYSLRLSTCPLTADPSDPDNWTHNPTDLITYNPSGANNEREGPRLVTGVVIGGTIHLLVGNGGTCGSDPSVRVDIFHYTSTDGVNFTNNGVVIAGDDPDLAGRGDDCGAEMQMHTLFHDGSTSVILYGGAGGVTTAYYAIDGDAINDWDPLTSRQILPEHTQIPGVRHNTMVLVNGSTGYFQSTKKDGGVWIQPFTLTDPDSLPAAPVVRAYPPAFAGLLAGNTQGPIYAELGNGRYLMWRQRQDTSQLGSNQLTTHVDLLSVGDWTPGRTDTARVISQAVKRATEW